MTYYSTAAQVLPLLLLAIVVELRSFGSPLGFGTNMRVGWLLLVSWVLTLGFVAEGSTFRVLARGHVKGHEKGLIAAGLIVVAIAAAVGLMVRVTGLGEADNAQARRGLAIMLVGVVGLAVALVLLVPGVVFTQ